MRIVSLFSSSKANSTYIENNGEGILVDVGCSYKALCEGLKAADRSTENIRAVFITHEHIDHIGGLLQLTKQLDVPIYGSEGTLRAIIEKGKAAATADLRLIDDLEAAPVNMDVFAFRTPHDSAESVGYTFTANDTKAAICTDLGRVTDEVRAALLGCRFVLLEANYDLEMLTRNLKYPPSLKQRIRSDMGHLSNGDSGSFARELIKSGTVSLMLGHLSRENNTPEIAFGCVSGALAAAGAQVNKDYLLSVAAVCGTGKGVTV